MASDKQIAANRENAKKSTGPTTQHGKTISSMNALKIGIDVKSEFIRPEGEADLERLTAEYYTDFAPANAIERALVDQLIRNERLNRRYAAIESALWEKTFRRTESEDLGSGFLSLDDTLMKLDRLRNSAQRHYAKALKELLVLRKARNAQVPVRETIQPELFIPKLASFDIFSEPVDPGPQTEPLPVEDDPPIAA